VSRFPVGSSASTSGGSFIKALATATRCCMPPESWRGQASAQRPSPMASRSASAGAFMLVWKPPRAAALGSMTFSMTLRPGRRWWDWKINPSFSPRSAVSAWSSRFSTARPSMAMRPCVGRSRRPMRFSSVLLPEPDGPTSATSSPSPMERSMPWRTSVMTPSPYDLRTPSSSSSSGRAFIRRLEWLPRGPDSPPCAPAGTPRRRPSRRKRSAR
jgi:hypothetical protein